MVNEINAAYVITASNHVDGCRDISYTTTDVVRSSALLRESGYRHVSWVAR